LIDDHHNTADRIVVVSVLCSVCSQSLTRRGLAVTRRMYSASAITQAPLIAVYKDKTPVKLFRIATGKGKKINLRERSAQVAKGSPSFDFTIQSDGLIHPMTGPDFMGPNGMSLRPNGMSQYEILAGMRGEVSVTEIPEGVPIPEGLVLLHEHTDHFSMQSTVACTPRELNNKLTKFVEQYERYPKSEWFKRYSI
jgi:hypothetical protein